MKKILFLLMFVALNVPNELKAEKAEQSYQVIIKLCAIDPSKQLGKEPRSPNFSVYVLQDSHTFTFKDYLAGETIEIMSGDTVVYTYI